MCNVLVSHEHVLHSCKQLVIASKVMSRCLEDHVIDDIAFTICDLLLVEWHVLQPAPVGLIVWLARRAS